MKALKRQLEFVCFKDSVLQALAALQNDQALTEHDNEEFGNKLQLALLKPTTCPEPASRPPAPELEAAASFRRSQKIVQHIYNFMPKLEAMIEVAVRRHRARMDGSKFCVGDFQDLQDLQLSSSELNHGQSASSSSAYESHSHLALLPSEVPCLVSSLIFFKDTMVASILILVVIYLILC